MTDTKTITEAQLAKIRRDVDGDTTSARWRAGANWVLDEIAALPSGADSLDVNDLGVLVRALTIDRISWDGDGWYAEDAGYDYESAEATLDRASAIVARLASPAEPPGTDPDTQMPYGWANDPMYGEQKKADR